MTTSDPRAAAVHALFEAHYTGLVRFIYRSVDDHQLAEELAAECFVRALRRKDLDKIGRGWLYRTARNVIGDTYRRREREKRAIEALAHAAPQTSSNVDDGFDDALARLGERDRTILQLLHADGLEAQEVAEAMGMSVAAVWKRASRARDRVRTLTGRDAGTAFEQGVIAVAMD